MTNPIPRRSLLALSLLILAPAAAPALAADQAAPKPSKAEQADQVPSPALLDPSLAKEQAPKLFKARFSTSKGDFVVEVHREWAPRAADRFYNLVKHGWFDDVAFFRVVSGFMVQFGINGEPARNGKWREARIDDDLSIGQSNSRGMITFATSGQNSRTTQLFINFGDNARLDRMGFTPFGKVTQGMEVVDKLYSGYGEGAPMGRGPDQGRVQAEGNAYLKKDFPQLDYVKKARLEK